MNKIYFILFILSGIFTIPTLHGQSYNKLADSCFFYLESNNLTGFCNEYVKLYPQYCREQIPEYQKALNSIEKNDYTASLQYLMQIIDEDYTSSNLIMQDPRFKILHSYPEWLYMVHKTDSLEKNQCHTLKNELQAMQYEDQGIRLLLMVSYKKYGRVSEMSLNIRKRMKYIDSLNSIRVQKIIDDHGWLGEDKLGEEGNETLFLCIQHVDDLAIQKKYLPILKNAVETGNAEPWHYAFLTDRVLMNKGEKQIYGTQVISSDDPAKSYVVPLQDPDHVDRLRKEIGLESLKEYLKDEGIDWNIDEYKKKLPDIEKRYKERSHRPE